MTSLIEDLSYQYGECKLAEDNHTSISLAESLLMPPVLPPIGSVPPPGNGRLLMRAHKAARGSIGSAVPRLSPEQRVLGERPPVWICGDY